MATNNRRSFGFHSPGPLGGATAASAQDGGLGQVRDAVGPQGGVQGGQQGRPVSPPSGLTPPGQAIVPPPTPIPDGPQGLGSEVSGVATGPDNGGNLGELLPLLIQALLGGDQGGAVAPGPERRQFNPPTGRPGLP